MVDFNASTITALDQNRTKSAESFPNSLTVPLGHSATVPPTARSVNPDSGTGGTTVVITGRDFTRATAVTFGDTAAIRYTVNSDGKITAVAPNLPAGKVNVRVTNSYGVSAAVVFTYVAAPTIISVSPNTGIDTGGTLVTIVGTGLLGTTSVEFGGVLGTALNVLSKTELRVITPANSTGVKTVTVTSAGGTGSSVNGFTVQPSVTTGPTTPTENYTTNKKITIFYAPNSTRVPTSKLAELRAAANQFKLDQGTIGIVSVKGFVSKVASTQFERNLASLRARSVTKVLRDAGLKAKYTTTGDGLASQVGPRARKVVVNISYQVRN